MKKVIRLLFILQLVVFAIIGESIFFQYRFIDLFYKDKTYVDVLTPDLNTFDTFLSWTRERDIAVSRVIISPDKEVILHMCDWMMENEISLVEGKYPQGDEFISDVETGEDNQSGVIKRLLPSYHIKVYSLFEPEWFCSGSLYAVSLTSEQEINEMISELGKMGIDAQLSEINNTNAFFSLFSAYSRVEIIIVFIFLCSTTIILLTTILQYVIQMTKSMNIRILAGYERTRIVGVVVKDLLPEMNWMVLLGIFFTTVSCIILLNSDYRAFYLPMIVVFIGVLLCLFMLYVLLISGFVSGYLISRKKKQSVSPYGVKPNGVVYLANFGAKVSVSILFLLAIAYLGVLCKQFFIEKQNLQGWKKSEDIYQLSMNYIGQDDLRLEVELTKRIEKLYQYLSQENNAFFMDSVNIQGLEVFGIDCPVDGLDTEEGFETYIAVSPNYFKFNPIVTSENEPVENKIVYADNVLNLLVPENLSHIHEELTECYLDKFNFYRFVVYDSIYSEFENDTWNPSRQELIVNIIPVKNDQLYFTFSPDVRQNSGNKILDPVVVVYTDNVHPSNTFYMASRCLFFQYDNSQKRKVDDYLAQIVEMDGFVYGHWMWLEVAGRVLRLERNYVAIILLAAFIVIGYLVIDFCLWTNYFTDNQYSITISTLWGLSKIRTYKWAIVSLFISTLMASGSLYAIMKLCRPRLLPIMPVKNIVLISIFMIGLDAIYFVLLEKKLCGRSMNSILKGEVS